MHRSRGDMASPTFSVLLLATLTCVSVCRAGPVGPLPNVTSSDIGLREGSCAVGDVVYMAGDEFPGSGPCERCSCSVGGVHCSKQRCEPRPGCKALHRPDHCCPTYQCECEQEGRVYGNGEKLVDPNDPCRVCYCQGGEVVCRRIACFVRDDCRPRLVPGRCCPEYDNCPLRGITTIPGVAPSISSIAAIEDVGTSAQPAVPKENIKQEITIKEITPVSEIPIITNVKIKEILPSPSIEVAEYSSSKSPLIPREATSEKPNSNEFDLFNSSETPVVVEVKPSSSPVVIASLSPETKTKQSFSEIKSTQESFPSKISFSTQDSINSEIYPSNSPNVALMGSPSGSPDVAPMTSTTKAPIVEEEDPSLFDHNPAFPPLPDDLSVLSNHDDEIVPESNIENEHVPNGHEIVNEASTSTSTRAPIKELLTTTSKNIPESTLAPTTKLPETSTEGSSTKLYIATTAEPIIIKGSPMLNLRSAIPTEILTVASSVPEDINGELDDIVATTVSEESIPMITSATTETTTKIEEKLTTGVESQFEDKNFSISSTTDASITKKPNELTESPFSSKNLQYQTTSSIVKSNIATEITSQTELSSLPIETSDQKPHESSAIVAKDIPTTTLGSTVVEFTSVKVTPTVSENTPTPKTPSSTTTEAIHSFENIETTEFLFTSFGSSETTTDTVELIKVSGDPEKSAAIIEPTNQKNSVLTDLINLVGDVASISDHTDEPETRHSTFSSGISESEELIPVNAGYKSKNNNWNVNSITEVPLKNKNPSVNKQKIVEIEDDESSITDSPPPYDKVEPTTRRPIIDNVSDMMPLNKTDKKDIEIITQSYVPTISKRPTKVVMKKSNEKLGSEEISTDVTLLTASSEVGTEFTPTASGPGAGAVGHSAESIERIAERTESPLSSSTQ